jgi:hypothetical protein
MTVPTDPYSNPTDSLAPKRVMGESHTPTKRVSMDGIRTLEKLLLSHGSTASLLQGPPLQILHLLSLQLREAKGFLTPRTN